MIESDGGGVYVSQDDGGAVDLNKEEDPTHFQFLQPYPGF